MLRWLVQRAGALACFLLFAVPPVTAQTVPSQDVPTAPVQPSDRVRVYLDCPGGGPGGGGFQDQCFSEYLRERIDFVDFVRQPQDAEVHVLASGQETGGGGREVVLRFVGRERFVGHDHALRALTQIGDTENTRRAVVLRTVIIGLLDFVAHDGIPPGVNLSVTTGTAESVEPAPVEDPWNLWVFSVRLNTRTSAAAAFRPSSTSAATASRRAGRSASAAGSTRTSRPSTSTRRTPSRSAGATGT